jgi:hypothetical protein
MDIIRPALQVTSLWSPSAENILVGTALTETDLIFIKQEGGPALSYYQIEPSTYLDCIRYLNTKNEHFKDSILNACGVTSFPSADALMWNMRLATLIARIKYYMCPESLPDHDDFHGMTSFYLRIYNAGGKATYEHAVPFFKEACASY